MKYKLRHGADSLPDKFDAAELDDVIDVGREPVVGRR